MFDKVGRKNQFQTLVSPKDKQVKGSLSMYQQGYILMIDLDENFETEYHLKNGAYFFLIDGAVSVADENLEKRDAIGILETAKVSIKASIQSKLLVIDIPMK
jgi:redox-sensitive bicupin YhaK (pirin superfamily)